MGLKLRLEGQLVSTMTRCNTKLNVISIPRLMRPVMKRHCSDPNALNYKLFACCVILLLCCTIVLRVMSSLERM